MKALVMPNGHVCHTEALRFGLCAGGESCPHRSCWNPAHLEAVSNEENRRRGNHFLFSPRRREVCGRGHDLTDPGERLHPPQRAEALPSVRCPHTARQAAVIKALTLWQPWAALVEWRYKLVETRSWQTSYTGPLAIHSAKREPRDWPGPNTLTRGMAGQRYGSPPTPWVLRNLDRPSFAVPLEVPLYLGCVLATCELVGCFPTERVRFAPLVESHWRILPGPSIEISEMEREVGDYRPGRFVWLLRNVAQLPHPIPARGRQQLWDWNEVA